MIECETEYMIGKTDESTIHYCANRRRVIERQTDTGEEVMCLFAANLDEARRASAAWFGFYGWEEVA